MIALKIIVNGQLYTTIGQEDWSVLTAGVAATRPDGPNDIGENIRFNLGGLSRPNSEGIIHHFRWRELNLKPGDNVAIEVVETAEVDHPLKRYRSDREVQENPFTEEEWREMRYKDYLELKNEFENT
jgi:hypothetical protein